VPVVRPARLRAGRTANTSNVGESARTEGVFSRTAGQPSQDQLPCTGSRYMGEVSGDVEDTDLPPVSTKRWGTKGRPRVGARGRTLHVTPGAQDQAVASF